MCRGASPDGGVRRNAADDEFPGITRCAAAAQHRPVGGDADWGVPAAGSGARRARAGADVRQGPERQPRHRVRHVSRAGAGCDGRSAARDRHGGHRKRDRPYAWSGTELCAAERPVAPQHRDRLVLCLLGRPAQPLWPTAARGDPATRSAERHRRAGHDAGAEPEGNARRSRRRRCARQSQRAGADRRQPAGSSLAGRDAAPARHPGVRHPLPRGLSRPAAEQSHVQRRRKGDRRLSDGRVNEDRFPLRPLPAS